ncbi:DNA-directed RNA polymerase I subunit 1-like [Lycium ferocissimum]|uniref:DNA-directed RNA polymerase I subunit 1-like n=1 Tax=Lycium ferocissimum TaxID=112874 RepID=UPI002815227A|nr:DNA-directed RNA polymerase I subunit 1-like [Lycium ferocissimum]
MIQGATETVEAVHFSFMTNEEVHKHSVVKVTNPNLLDTIGQPVPGGLYDPAMGSLDDNSQCKSCGQRSRHCPGHCGHIELVSPVYNPLLFNMLYNLLQRTCFYCLHFRAPREEVEKCVSELESILKGDVIGAKNVISSDNSTDQEESEGSHMSYTIDDLNLQDRSEYNKRSCWDNFQFTEAMAVIDGILKTKSKKCSNCKAKNPKITKPSFGRFHMDTSSTEIKENFIKDQKFNLRYGGGSEENPSPEVLNATELLGEAETSLYEASSDGLENSMASGRHGVDQSGVIKQQKDLLSLAQLPSLVRNIIKDLWENEARLCEFFCDIQGFHRDAPDKVAGPSMFFLDSILVPPIKFRPPAKGGNSVMEHPHTVLLGKVLQSNIALGNAHMNRAGGSKIISRLMDLQQSVNVLFDSKTAAGPGQKDVGTGICQLLEKKEGIFRQKMMGKRVNFACRSVISPDPYLSVNEIGIPPYFALRLTYPERLTPWNAFKMRDAILNGPETLPGAVSVADRISIVKLPPGIDLRKAISRKLPSSRGAVTQSGRDNEFEFEGKVVYRHLQDGDIVLVNRQPTLHKPSIMAHVVRILKGEKTLRMHYANCSTYNADFDGDEMNVHFPQDEISRAEAYNIVNANEQYIVPTKGDTVRGLIQDHIVGAVLLTMKNTFLTLEEFNQLLYGSGMFAAGPGLTSGNHLNKVPVIDSEGFVETILPAVWKPKPLWTGKQVITALLNHLTKGCAPCTVKNKGKIPYPYFLSQSRLAEYQSREEEEEDRTAENKFLIWKNELVRGVIDKAQFGKFGLVHTIQELYGSNKAGILLSALSRLFTIFLQFHGFTCGIDDLVILPHYDIRRKEELEGEDVGEEAHCDFVKFKRGEIGPLELQLEIEKAISSNKEAATATLDMKMKNKLVNKGSQFNKELLLKGLLKRFPRNCIALMTITGAKGSTNQETICQKLCHGRKLNSYIEKLPDGLEEKVKHFWENKAKKLEKKLEKQVKKEEILKQLKEEEADFLQLVEQKYLSSLADSGEPVGVLAGQSVGEPSTQMTLNTFHLAGRGEMNVTLGIPRLQEILMTASDVIKTPIMTCPFLGWKSKDDARSLLAEVKKITLADVIESMEVNLFPLSIHNNKISRLYKLTVKLKKHEFVSSEDCKYTLKYVFKRELEDAIESHLALLSKINGIKDFKSSSESVASNETEENASSTRHDEEKLDDDDDDEAEDERTEDLSSDAQKRKRQTTDEMDYEDSCEDEAETTAEVEEGDPDQGHDTGSREEEEETGDPGNEEQTPSKSKTEKTIKQKKNKEKHSKKDSDRSVFTAVEGLHFEVHFRFIDEPHILLAQVAQKTAKKVYIKNSGKIDQCRMVKYEVTENTVIWDEKQTKKQSQVADSAYWALKAAGIDFGTFWKMQDHLDVNRIYTNNIRAILNTYGVEAARAAIIREVKTVFGIYGVEVDYRHLSLIADYMTHTGGYQPMSRHGRISESLSPFLKMSFETASKFIVEAASHGLTDYMETPSSRICLGLPVKMGTGCFDIMQKLDI